MAINIERYQGGLSSIPYVIFDDFGAFWDFTLLLAS